MHGFQSSSCCVELGDRRLLQSEVENEQCLRRLVGRAHSDIMKLNSDVQIMNLYYRYREFWIK